MYAVSEPRPLRKCARDFIFHETSLRTSAEVLQELMRAYLPVSCGPTLDAALSLVTRSGIEVWPLGGEGVRLAHELHERRAWIFAAWPVAAAGYPALRRSTTPLPRRRSEERSAAALSSPLGRLQWTRPGCQAGGRLRFWS